MAREEERKEGAPEWITTFADMMSLLLTFFVFILTFSTIETDTYQKVTGALQGGMKITPINKKQRVSLESDVPPKDIEHIPEDAPGAETPPEKIIEVIKDKVEMAARKIDEDDQVFDIDEFEDGIRILPSGGVFRPSRADLDSQWSTMVRNVADVVVPYGRRVVVRGHTDTQFLPTTRYPTPEDVAVARAIAVAVELEKGGVPAGSIEIRGGGANSSPYSNDTPRDRARNRTFEIVLLDGNDR